MPFVAKERIAQRQSVGNGEVECLVIAAEAEAALPEREDQSERHQGDEQIILPSSVLFERSLFRDGLFEKFVENDDVFRQHVEHKGEQRRGDKAERHREQIIGDPVDHHGDVHAQVLINQLVKDEGAEIDAEREVGQLPQSELDNGLPVVGSDAGEQLKEQHCQHERHEAVPVAVGACFEAAAVAAEPVEHRENKQRNAKQRRKGERSPLQTVLSEVRADEVVGDRINAQPERGDQLLELIAGRGRHPPFRALEIEDIEQRRQNGDRNEGDHQDPLLFLAVQLVVREIEEGGNQEQADVHFDVPRVVRSREVERAEDEVD